MNTLYLDFETSSGSDIKKHGGPRHVADPRAKITCMSYAINSGQTDVIKHDDCTRLRLVPKLISLINSVDRVVAHKALFEMAVLMYILGMPIHLPKWVCTAAKAAYHGYPHSLDEAAKALGCSSLKDVQGKANMIAIANHPDWTPQSHPNEYNRLYSYNAADIAPMREIDQKLPDLPDTVRAQWELDAEINMRGVPIDVKAIRNAIKLVEELKIKNDYRMAQLTATAENGWHGITARQPEQLVKWVESKGIPMIDCTAATVVKMLNYPVLPADVAEVLELRQAAGLSSLAKYQKMLDYEIDGRLYYMFTFYGAHTGRPTGSGPQVMNPPRGEDPMKWAELLCECPEYFSVIDKPDERLKEAIRGVISVA